MVYQLLFRIKHVFSREKLSLDLFCRIFSTVCTWTSRVPIMIGRTVCCCMFLMIQCHCATKRYMTPKTNTTFLTYSWTNCTVLLAWTLNFMLSSSFQLWKNNLIFITQPGVFCMWFVWTKMLLAFQNSHRGWKEGNVNFKICLVKSFVCVLGCCTKWANKGLVPASRSNLR